MRKETGGDGGTRLLKADKELNATLRVEIKMPKMTTCLSLQKLLKSTEVPPPKDDIAGVSLVTYQQEG